MNGCGDGHCSFPRSDTSVVERRQAAFSKSQSAISKSFSWLIQEVSPDTVRSLWQHLTFFGSNLIPRGTGNEQVACCTQMTNMIKIVIIYKKNFQKPCFFSIKFLQVFDKQKERSGAAVRNFGSGSRRQFNLGSGSTTLNFKFIIAKYT